MFFASLPQQQRRFWHLLEVRVGYVLAEHAWGTGYTSELLRGFTAQWDERRPPARLLAGVARENIASRRVLGGKDIRCGVAGCVNIAPPRAWCARRPARRIADGSAAGQDRFGATSPPNLPSSVNP
ncbi:GNAT family N-acetyltransferase, partial [Enhygromyxa salina]|uniref:GNAT family N-acetyltransferase n=1 Tax=Enhygromyxa salina TaxID=215803 RepID=UPI0011B1D5DB